MEFHLLIVNRLMVITHPQNSAKQFCDKDCLQPCNPDIGCHGPTPSPPPPSPPPPSPHPPSPHPPSPPPPSPHPPSPPPTNNCNSFAWSKNNTVKNEEKASAFMRNAVNEYGCFKNGFVVAGEDGGMKGEGWNGAKSTLKCLCPYGMTYNEDSTNYDMTKIIGNNCVDVKPPNVQKCKNYIMGQCLDKNETYHGNKPRKNIFNLVLVAKFIRNRPFKLY